MLRQRRVNPLLADVLTSMSYYGVPPRAEYATELMFDASSSTAG